MWAGLVSSIDPQPGGARSESGGTAIGVSIREKPAELVFDGVADAVHEDVDNRAGPADKPPPPFVTRPPLLRRSLGSGLALHGTHR
jgi:hypothetical protein